MGIQGLLKALKPFTNPVHVQKYAGQRVGIDAYSWLHKGAYGCSTELCRESGLVPAEDPSKHKYVKYCMHRISMLKFYGVIPVVVFDGGRLPLKADTENERQRQREKNLATAQEHQARGDFETANDFFQRAVEITPLMANEFVRVLKDSGVEFIVSPYEADAQLAWLAKRPSTAGGVAAVISEDSDLLAYGCPVVIYKMDKFGQGEEISMKQVLEPGEVPGTKLSFGKFESDMFLGIGIMKAHAIVEKYENLDWVLSKIAKEKKVTLPENYIRDFWQARAIFLHARVYDTDKRALEFLNPLPEDFEERCGKDTDFLGPDLPQSRARAIAQGQLDPITMCAFNVSGRKTVSSTPFTPYVNRVVKQEVRQSAGTRGPFSFFSSSRAGRGEALTAQTVSSSQLFPCSSKHLSSGQDDGFAAHLERMAADMASATGRSTSSVLQEHNGVKRVLPLPPPQVSEKNSNPFKRARHPCEQSWVDRLLLLSGGDDKENLCAHEQQLLEEATAEVVDEESQGCCPSHVKNKRGEVGGEEGSRDSHRSLTQQSGVTFRSDITDGGREATELFCHDDASLWPAAEEALLRSRSSQVEWSPQAIAEPPESQESSSCSTGTDRKGTGMRNSNNRLVVVGSKHRINNNIRKRPWERRGKLVEPATVPGGGILRFFKPLAGAGR